MKKATYFLLAALALVTLAAVLAITLTAKKGERKGEVKLSTADASTQTDELPVTEYYVLTTGTDNNELNTGTDDYELSTGTDDYEWDDSNVENSTFEVPTTYSPEYIPYTLTPEQIQCGTLTGRFVDGKFVGQEIEYDLEKILEMHGGAPGNLNMTGTWTEKADPPLQNSEVEMRPLPDADEKYWIYKYGDSDAKTYIRIEHAVRRFSGTPRAFLEIRGTVYFTPDDYCGNSRLAYYTVDDRGFTFEVSREYCSIGHLVSCVFPTSCFTNADGIVDRCVAAPSLALLYALIGGGK